MKNENEFNDHLFLRAKSVAERYDFSERHLYRLVERGEFPEPKQFGKLLRWKQSDLEEWEKNGCPPIFTEKRKVHSKKYSR